MRIEEIRKKWSSKISQSPDEDRDIDDVEYILAKLDLAQTALESVVNAPAREIMRKYAERALDKLKD